MRVPLTRYRDLLGIYLAPQWRKVLLLAALIGLSIGLQLANPQIVRFFIDNALAGSAIEPLIAAGLTFLGAALALQATTVAATYVGEAVGWTATNALRADLALHCLRLDMSFHNQHTPGAMIERIDGDVANLAIFFAQFVVRVLAGLLLLVGVLIVLLFEDWRLSLALTIYTLIALVGLILFRRIAVPHWTASREASAQLFGFLEEQLAGTEDIRASGATGYALRGLFGFNRTRLEKERKAGTMNVLMAMLWFALFTLGQGLAFVAGYSLFQEGTLTLGTVYLLISYTEAIFRPLHDITQQLQHFQKAAASIERIDELYHTRSAIHDGTGDLLPSGPLAVAFDGVSFSYAGSGVGVQGSGFRVQGSGAEGQPIERMGAEAEEQEAAAGDHEALHPSSFILHPSEALHSSTPHTLHEISFRLEPGEVLGLLGRTGSGKTTLTRLLFRLYDPVAGSIRLGDADRLQDLRELRLDDLRRRVGIVTQEVQLFRASVRDNLTFFDRAGISDQRILRTIDELGLELWYRSLPHGLDTILEAGGAGLSAGEAQLLAFTRIFLRDPGLVILDEASSRLDPATEQLIERAVDRLLRDRTGIIIAHRLATVHRADQILILEAGRVREYGPRAHLASDPRSHFSRLLRTGLEEVLA